MAEYVRPIDALAAEMIDRLDAKNAEIARLRARLETVEAETRERCAKVADEVEAGTSDERHKDCDYWAGFDDGTTTSAAAIRNLEPRHD